MTTPSTKLLKRESTVVDQASRSRTTHDSGGDIGAITRSIKIWNEEWHFPETITLNNVKNQETLKTISQCILARCRIRSAPENVTRAFCMLLDNLAYGSTAPRADPDAHCVANCWLTVGLHLVESELYVQLSDYVKALFAGTGLIAPRSLEDAPPCDENLASTTPSRGGSKSVRRTTFKHDENIVRCIVEILATPRAGRPTAFPPTPTTTHKHNYADPPGTAPRHSEPTNAAAFRLPLQIDEKMAEECDIDYMRFLMYRLRITQDDDSKRDQMNEKILIFMEKLLENIIENRRTNQTEVCERSCVMQDLDKERSECRERITMHQEDIKNLSKFTEGMISEDALKQDLGALQAEKDRKENELNHLRTKYRNYEEANEAKSSQKFELQTMRSEIQLSIESAKSQRLEAEELLFVINNLNKNELHVTEVRFRTHWHEIKDLFSQLKNLFGNLAKLRWTKGSTNLRADFSRADEAFENLSKGLFLPALPEQNTSDSRVIYPNPAHREEFILLAEKFSKCVQKLNDSLASYGTISEKRKETEQLRNMTAKHKANTRDCKVDPDVIRTRDNLLQANRNRSREVKAIQLERDALRKKLAEQTAALDAQKSESRSELRRIEETVAEARKSSSANSRRLEAELARVEDTIKTNLFALEDLYRNFNDNIKPAIDEQLTIKFGEAVSPIVNNKILAASAFNEARVTANENIADENEDARSVESSPPADGGLDFIDKENRLMTSPAKNTHKWSGEICNFLREKLRILNG